MEGYTLIDVVCQIEIYIVKIFAQKPGRQCLAWGDMLFSRRHTKIELRRRTECIGRV